MIAAQELFYLCVHMMPFWNSCLSAFFCSSFTLNVFKICVILCVYLCIILMLHNLLFDDFLFTVLLHCSMMPYYLGCGNQPEDSLWINKYQPEKAIEVRYLESHLCEEFVYLNMLQSLMRKHHSHHFISLVPWPYRCVAMVNL